MANIIFGIKLNIGMAWMIGRLALVIACFFGASAPTTAQYLPEFPPVDFQQHPAAQVALGQLLFYDPILSGNRNISCATCHHPKFATSDGVSLALGEGGSGLGPERVGLADNFPEERIPRNAPALFNLGAAEFTSMFHDGRLEADASQPSGIRTPLAATMVTGFDSVLSAQAMFPVLSGDEMAGHYSENDVSQAVRQGFLSRKDGAWDIIAARVQGITEYRGLFDNVIGARDIEFTDIANMIAGFIAAEWRADNSPFDQYIAGGTLKPNAMAGLGLFYGKAGCADCHSGRFQTDQGFHAIAMPQIGPGKAARFETHHRDTGRMRVTGAAVDAYRFRTPSLRNIALTGPYGHDGAYRDLESVVRHHLDPVASLYDYDSSQAVLPEFAGKPDFALLALPSELAAIAAANELTPNMLSDVEVSQLIAFLNSLSDESVIKGRLGIPVSVPSGLPVDR
jgi:cytochrome c peroxidase